MSDALRFLKSNSSGWVHDKCPDRKSFAWQLGYDAFSVSKSNVPEVLIYVGNQRAPHKRLTIREELIDFLIKHAIEYDERYIWN